MTPLYPRWGFLDKFAVNEYMARSLLVTIGLWFAGEAAVSAWLALRPEMVRLRPHPGPPITDVVFFDRYELPAPPPVVAPPRPKPRAKVDRVAGGDLVLVDDLVGIDDWDSQGIGGGTGTETESGAATEGIDSVGDLVDIPTRPEDWVVYEHGPELISIRPTEYPEIAREAGIEGKVFVRVLVGADGFVHAAEILEGVLGLDEAALAAARTAVFKPAEQQGRAVATWMVIPIEFALRDH